MTRANIWLGAALLAGALGFVFQGEPLAQGPDRSALPKPGDTLAAHQVFGTIEAVKAVADLYAPLAGTVVEVNGALDADPAVVNRDPYGEGWMVKLRLTNAADLDSLLGADAYRAHIGG